METFALVAFLIVGGQVESFAVDHHMSRSDCELVAAFATVDTITADPGVRIAVQTAPTEPTISIACVAEKSA